LLKKCNKTQNRGTPPFAIFSESLDPPPTKKTGATLPSGF